jgi:hypothetical protein
MIELRTLVATLRELGVTHYRNDGLELDLDPGWRPPAAPSEAAPVDDLKALDAAMPSDEDMLNWSVAGPLPSEVPVSPPKE